MVETLNLCDTLQFVGKRVPFMNGFYMKKIIEQMQTYV